MTDVIQTLQELRSEVAGAVTGACTAHHRSRTWSAFDLGGSIEDLWRLNDGTDCCYDRPSIGLNYAMWYHARRTQDVLRMVLPSWTRRPPETVLDLGAGTGATPWAAAIAATAGVPIGPARVICVDGSPPMLDAAEQMWEALRSHPTFGAAASALDVEFRCRSWTQPEVAEDVTDLISSYMFDDSDVGRLPEVVAGFARVADGVRAERVHLLGSGSKAAIVAGVTARMAELGWEGLDGDRPPVLWTGQVDGLRPLRRVVLQDVHVEVPWDRRAPSFTHRGDGPLTPTLVRTHAPPMRLGSPSTFLLDDAQRKAAQPEHRMTVVVGPAGSGKSRVLVERIVRTAEDAAGDVDVLVTAFNIDLLHQLSAWVKERLSTSTIDLDGSWADSDGAITIRLRSPLGRSGRIRLLNWDKVPTRLFGVRAVQTDPRRLDEELEARVDHLVQQRGLQLTPGLRRTLSPTFLKAEMQRVIWGLGAHTLDTYVRADRRGRGHGLDEPSRRAVWDVMMVDGHLETFSHVRLRAMSDGLPKQVFSHLFIDECQDFTPQDFQLASRLVEDSRAITVFGDESQALHLGASYRRPGQLAGRDGASHRWTARYELESTYRLPLRICEAVERLAAALGVGHGLVHDSDGEPLDLVDLKAVTGATLGIRPVLIAGTESEVRTQIREVLDTYEGLFEPVVSANRVVTLAEGETWGREDMRALVPDGYRFEVASMTKIKGLERPVVIWSTRTRVDADDSLPEWIYTILTRTTGLLIILLSHQIDDDVARVLRLLRRDRLLPWTPEAAARLPQAQS